MNSKKNSLKVINGILKMCKNFLCLRVFFQTRISDFNGNIER